MKIIQFIYENIFETICLLVVIGVVVSGIVLAFKGKNFWGDL